MTPDELVNLPDAERSQAVLTAETPFLRDALNVSGVLVTRGDQDVSQILATWPFQRVVWDNAKRPDLKVLGRYEAMMRCRYATIYVQDDDCRVPVQALLNAYRGRMLLNIPPDENPLVGWGAVFRRDEAHQALYRYLQGFPFDDLFCRCCDLVVTGLTPHERVDLGHEDLPWADGQDRMYRDERHYEEREEVRERCRSLTT